MYASTLGSQHLRDGITIPPDSAESPNATIPDRRPQTKFLYNYTHYIGMP